MTKIAALYARKKHRPGGRLLRRVGTRRLLFVLIAAGQLLMLTPSSASGAGAWVVIHPDSYVGPPGFAAMWHAIRHRNAWVVMAAFDNQRECLERARRDVAEGILPLPEFRARRVVTYTDGELFMLKGVLMAARCMPIELAEKVGTLRVSDSVR